MAAERDTLREFFPPSESLACETPVPGSTPEASAAEPAGSKPFPAGCMGLLRLPAPTTRSGDRKDEAAEVFLARTYQYFQLQAVPDERTLYLVVVFMGG